MDDSKPSVHLRLAEALTRWCAPELVAAVRTAECEHTAHDLESTDLFTLANPSAWRQPLEREWMLGPPNFARLFAAWARLLDDFRRRIEQSEIYLEGTLSTADGATQAQAIPNTWAAELKFDFRRNTVSRGEQRYLAITASKTPSSWSPVEHQTEDYARKLPPLTPKRVRDLSDEDVLLLLEEHARRVVEQGAQMIAPGKISLMPIVRRRMEYRAENGQLAASVSTECRILAEWISEKAPSHQTPTASSIENALRSRYAELKARSTGTIPRSPRKQ